LLLRGVGRLVLRVEADRDEPVVVSRCERQSRRRPRDGAEDQAAQHGAPEVREGENDRASVAKGVAERHITSRRIGESE